MIVKDEEIHLKNCLDSIASCVDEIIIIDTGSKDQTKNIAKRYTKHVYDFTWVDDFSKARNYSFQYASKDYCMWLDADDILQDQEAFLKLKENLSPTVDMVMMKYLLLPKDKHQSSMIFYRERLIKRSSFVSWQGFVHEVIPLKGNILYQDIAIIHCKQKKNEPNRNLNIYNKMLKENVFFHPRDLFYYARELMDQAQYEKAISIFSSLIERNDLWIENAIEACRNLSDCYQKINQPEKALQSLLKSFSFDIPRAETCCEIGQYFLNKKEYKIAIFWYQIALSSKKDTTKGSFILADCYDFIPSIQLCVCYYALQDKEKAYYYHKLSCSFKENHPLCQYNEQFFH